MPAPRLPAGGESSALSTIAQSLSFHSSPHSFLTARQQTVDEAPEKSRPLVVRARILNRDVAVVASREHCVEILDVKVTSSASSQSAQKSVVAARPGQNVGRGSFGVLPAYRELMADFFPQPNLLLLDAPDHEFRRRCWDDHMAKVCHDSSATIREIAVEEISSWQAGAEVDLYDRMKDLAWRMLLAVFLQLSRTDQAYQDVVAWQEELLRGQFSLFPVSIRTPFWRSPRSRGLNARRKLQEELKKHVDALQPQCPFHCPGETIGRDELASNALLFTSSIAVKALASLLTASLLNLYLFPSSPSLAHRARELDPDGRGTFVRSILRETERLSPPVIGVMRRVQQDVVLQQSCQGEDPGILIPTGWDAWLYFVGANRNESIYNEACSFVPERFAAESGAPPTLTFGFGDKSCLGRDISRQIVQTVTTVMLDAGIDLHGAVVSEGVRGWLGWDSQVPVESMARDLKQLPCQRPRKPIILRVSRNE
ncbi:hypothetical protein DL764_010570 [Monosporascus ibericus]|uniref:Cytochrome P450 n=1 Tax=Monosporascus ibericus TaxID=155417 RepID=A0A4Q4SSJ3_9PEZI|nr:hypothetical protein DL764_010570 [Monosporascus ibericus]